MISSAHSINWACPKPNGSSWLVLGAQYESEMVYHSIQEHLEKQGVIFLSPSRMG
jgi:Fe-S cluster assembly scaffold protein SufB